MKIDACLIIKNEPYCREFIEDQLTQFCDDIYIVDTGSDDGTYELLKEIESRNNKVHIYNDYVWKNDFGDARNHSFSKSVDSDYIFYSDGDDIIPQETIDKILEFKNANIIEDYDVYMFKYMYTLKAEVSTYSMRLVKHSDDLVWKYKLHEEIVHKSNKDIKLEPYRFVNSKIIHQYGDIKLNDLSRYHRNFEILKTKELNKEEFDLKELFYYAQTYYLLSNILIAHKLFEEVVYKKNENENLVLYQIISSTYCEIIEEKYPNFNFNVKSFELYKYLYEIINNKFSDFKRADLCTRLGIYYFNNNIINKSIKLFLEAIDVGYPFPNFDFAYLYNFSHNFDPYYYLAFCFKTIGNYKLGNKYCDMALSFLKENNLITENKVVYDDLVKLKNEMKI